MARGPQTSITCPVGAVPIAPGTNLIQAAVAANPAGTAFCLAVGTHAITSPILPKAGNTFCGTYGAIVDGTGWVSVDADDAAFKTHNTTVTGVTLRNLLIRNMPQRGVHCFGASATGWIIEYCEITACRTGLNFGSGTPGTGAGATIRNCYIHHNTVGAGTKGGYLMFRGINTLWEDNEISYNGSEQKIVGTTGVTFRGNYVHHNVLDGIWYDTDNLTVTIENNVVEDHARFGIHHEIGGSATIRNNTVVRSADTGIMIVTSKDTVVYGNILVNNYRGIDLFLKCSVVGGGTMPGGYDLSNVNVHDNTITVPVTNLALGSMLNTDPSTCTAAFLAPYLGGQKGIVWEGNHYYVPNLTTKYFWWQNAQTKSWAEWQALGNDTTGTYGIFTTPALLTADRLVYESKITLGTTPTTGGNPVYGRGLAFRMEGTTLKMFIGSYNPLKVLEYTVPASRTGTATFTRDLGTMPVVSTRFGLHWDETDSVLYSGNGLIYGSATGPVKTLSRARIENNVLVAEGQWEYSGVSYKATQGGVTAIPVWFQQTYGVGRLGTGFGGWFGVGANGPASVGPTLATFTPPATNSTALIPATRLQNYPYSSSGLLSVPRQRRPTNYKQYFENCLTDSVAPGFHPENNPLKVPIDPTIAGIGYWNAGIDYIDGGGAWVDTPNFSGFVTLATMGTGCCWYGNNWGFPCPCNNQVGTAAATNSTSRLHYWCITNPADLGAVARGTQTYSSIQSVMTAVQFPGLPITIAGSASAYPFAGYPNERFGCVGMAWIPSIQRLAVGLYQAQAIAPAQAGPVIFFYKVSEGGTPPVEGQPPSNDAFANAVALSGVSGSQAGSTINSTIQSGEPYALGSVWYTYTGGVNEESFSLSATGQTAQVYTGTSVGGLTQVTSGAAFTLPAGAIAYKIRVIPVVSTNGFTLTWAEIPPDPPDPPDPTPLPLVITNASLPIGEQTVPYSVTYSATGGVQPFTWTQSGAPSGITMSTSGVLSGTPVQNGTFSVVATVTDSQPTATNRTLSLTVVPPPVVTTLALTSGQINVAYPGATLAVSGGTSPYTWTQTGGPTGLTLSSTGIYTGTPTQSGSFTVVAVVTDARGATANRSLPLTIAAAPDALVVTTASLPAGQISVVYAGATMTATGGVAPYTWSQTGGPTGLSMSAGGSYSGTPTQSGNFTVAAKVTDSTLVQTTRNLLLVIAAETPPPEPTPVPPIVISTTSLPSGTVGVPYSSQLLATGGTPPLTWSSQNLPTGFTLSPSGLLAGTPTVESTVDVSFGVTDTSNPPLTSGVVLSLVVVGLPPDPNVDPPPTVTPPASPLLYQPRNKARKVSNVTTTGSVVRWYTVTGADGYKIFHGTTPNPPLIGTIQALDPAYIADFPSGTLFFPVTRAENTTYYWYVVALNVGGTTPSPLWKYTTAAASTRR